MRRQKYEKKQEEEKVQGNRFAGCLCGARSTPVPGALHTGVPLVRYRCLASGISVGNASGAWLPEIGCPA